MNRCLWCEWVGTHETEEYAPLACTCDFRMKPYRTGNGSRIDTEHCLDCDKPEVLYFGICSDCYDGAYGEFT